MSTAGASLRVQFIKYETIGDHTEYFIQISDQEQTWTVTCRYSKLAEVNSALKTINNKLPDFPPKKMFGSTNPQFISKRMSSLQHYVITLVNGGNKYKINPLMDLLMSGKRAAASPKADLNQQQPTKSLTTMSKKDESANAEQEIFRNFSKQLVQILKKNENFLLDEANETNRNTREIITQKQIFEKKRNFRLVAFADDVELEDAVLKKVVGKAATQLNEIIKSNAGPLPKDSEFVQELPN